MHIRYIPAGQMLVLALLIFLIGVVITAVMAKKTDVSSKVRKIVFWGSVIIGAIVVLTVGMNGFLIFRVPYTWNLYPWKTAAIVESVIVFLSNWGIIAVIFALFAVLILLSERVLEYVIKFAFDKLPKMASKISKWYRNLVKWKEKKCNI